jgi:hypothetical protein
MSECCHGTLDCGGQGEKHMCPPDNVHPAMKMAAAAIRAEEQVKLPRGPQRNAVSICGVCGGPTDELAMCMNGTCVVGPLYLGGAAGPTCNAMEDNWRCAKARGHVGEHGLWLKLEAVHQNVGSMVFDSGGVAGAGGGGDSYPHHCSTCYGPLSASRRCMNPDCPRFVGEPHAYPICGTGNPKTGFTCDLPDKHIGLHRDDRGPFAVEAIAQKSDNVDHPSHYTSSPAKCSACGHPIECIDVVQHWSFNLGNAGKYLWRQGKKLGVDATEDLRKSIWYINAEIKKLGGPK